jgi:hypothetical protein
MPVEQRTVHMKDESNARAPRNRAKQRVRPITVANDNVEPFTVQEPLELPAGRPDRPGFAEANCAEIVNRGTRRS